MSVDAQDYQYEEDPTGGVHLPSTGIAGEGDATAAVRNPAGLGFLRGRHLALALDLKRAKGTTSSGPGAGVYYASTFGGGGLVPKLGWGLAVEWLRPERSELSPDPGSPTRFTWSHSLALGAHSAIGLSWHHFFDENNLDGLDSFDFGWSKTMGAHWAAGFVVKGVNAPQVEGTSVQRHYALEMVSRPWGTDRLEFGVGARVGERDADLLKGNAIDGWLQWKLRLARGVYFRGELASDSLLRKTSTATSVSTEFVREHQLSLGLEFSFGGLGTTAYGTGARTEEGEFLARGGTFVARLSQEAIPSVLPAQQRMARMDLRGSIGQRQLSAMVMALRDIADDDDVMGLFLNIDGANAGWASLHELREEILRVRNSGKKVFAFIVDGGTRQYYLASAASKIYVDPAGGIRLQGFASSSMYFAGLFEKLGVLAQFERIEEYKSAPEAFTRTGPTKPAFRMRNEMYDSLYETIVGDIAAARGISRQRVTTLIDNGPYTSGELAKLPDLVDGVVIADKLAVVIATEMGQFYSFERKEKNRPNRWENPKIAIIYIDGDIVGGASRSIPLLGRRLVGGKTISQSIALANADEQVEAIVLRINSPGGSALASEFMAREVKKVRGHKPIVCSMSDLAASGGYYVAAYCDRIFADSMTITGSIGIFNGSFDVSGLLKKLGLSWVTYKRGAHSDLNSMYRPKTPAERKFIKQKLHYYYGRFLQAVAEGRSLTTEKVNDVGRGHVWTGKQSLSIHLVDELGGLMDAIGYAKRKAGLGAREEISYLSFPKQRKSLLSSVLGSPFGSDQSASPTIEQTGSLALQALGIFPGGMGLRLMEAIPGSIWSEPSAPQARLPFAIVWE